MLLAYISAAILVLGICLMAISVGLGFGVFSVGVLGIGIWIALTIDGEKV